MQLGFAGPRRTGLESAGARLDQFRIRIRSTRSDAWHDPVVRHLVRIYETVRLGLLTQRHYRFGEATIPGGEGGTKHAAGADLRRTLREPMGPGLPHGAQLLGIALVNAAANREVLVDPDVDAAGKRPTLKAAADDHEGLFVLRTHRVQQLLARGRARLPVRPDQGNRPRIFIRH